MDELIPAWIRDSRWFMYPFYYFAYRGRNIHEVMQFKRNVYGFTPEEYAHFYNNLNSISRNRKTDLNEASIDFILQHIDLESTSLIDIGCGSGYLLDQIRQKHPSISLSGFDIKEPSGKEFFHYVQGNIERLPFEDNSFDVVVCCHTIEHLLKLENCIAELERITKKQLFIVTPCQRYFYYTLDEHVNFFSFKESLTQLFQFENIVCEKRDGDWVLLSEK